MTPEIERFDVLPSTNSYLKEHWQGRGQWAVVTARHQTAGRGQRGNGWESEPGQNLLMSMLYYPPKGFAAMRQFEISMAVALAVADCVARLLPGAEVAVKWPNDVYVGGGKVAGILIENSLANGGVISHCVIGIGLNVNQLEFTGGAPNPISLLGEMPEGTAPFDIDDVCALLVESLRERFGRLDADSANCETLLREYNSSLWRRSGVHRWRRLVASAAPAPTALRDCGEEAGDADFEASIEGVDATGTIAMRTPRGELLRFCFKEVAPVL